MAEERKELMFTTLYDHPSGTCLICEDDIVVGSLSSVRLGGIYDLT